MDPTGLWCKGSTTDFDSVCLGSNPSNPSNKVTNCFRSGCSVARLSRLVWDQEVASSNLAIPTN